MWEENGELVKVLPVRFATIVVIHCTPEGTWATKIGSYVSQAPPLMQYSRFVLEGQSPNTHPIASTDCFAFEEGVALRGCRESAGPWS
jgi:hypothetical protein